MAKFIIYQDAKGEFRWRFQGNNGQILAESGKGYNNQANCQHGIVLLKQEATRAPIDDDLIPASPVQIAR